MKIITTNITTIAIVFAFVLSLVYIAFQAKDAESSVQVSNEYNGIVLTSANRGTSTVKLRAPATLGSVIISSTSPLSTSGAAIAFYDTSSSTRSTTTMTAFAQMGGLGSVTPPAGTYTFDITASSGLMIWVDPSFAGVYNVTYR